MEYEIRKIKKEELFKEVKRDRYGADYQIRNTYLKQSYALYDRDWRDTQFADSLRLVYGNEYKASRIQNHSRFAPVYSEKEYMEAIVNDDFGDIQPVGYTESWQGECVYVI